MRLLARVRGGSYLAASLAVITAACARPTAPLVPVGGFAPLGGEAFAAIAARTAPGGAELLQFRWRYEDSDRRVSGRGAARLAPPDSLRLDVGVPVLGRATLVMAGESAWADPDEIVHEVLPNRLVVWALFGVIRAPDVGTRIEVGEAADRRLFRLTSPDGTVTVLECRGDTLLRATEMKGERPVGQLVLARDAGGAVVRSEATDTEHATRFVVEVSHRETSGPFPGEIWRRP